MNTTTNNNITAPSITIAPRSPANGVLLYVVTITTVRDVRSLPIHRQRPQAGGPLHGWRGEPESQGDRTACRSCPSAGARPRGGIIKSPGNRGFFVLASPPRQ